MLSSSLFLIALAAVYSATGSLNFAQLATRLDELPDGTALMLQLLLLTTFAIKAAIFPLSFWLPDSYPTAPAPVTAVFAGLLTKVACTPFCGCRCCCSPTRRCPTCCCGRPC